MASDKTPRFGLPFLYAAQAQKEMFVNEALSLLDGLAQLTVASATTIDPPATPAPGACWIVPAGATGQWAGRVDEIALWTDGGWRFTAPPSGASAYVEDELARRTYVASVWVADGARADGYYVAGTQVIGARAVAVADPAGGSVADVECRMAVQSILAILRAHGLIEP